MSVGMRPCFPRVRGEGQKEDAREGVVERRMRKAARAKEGEEVGDLWKRVRKTEEDDGLYTVLRLLTIERLV